MAMQEAKFNPNTGQPLLVGETATKDGITYVGTTPVVLYNPKTGEKLSKGESVIDSSGRTITQGQAWTPVSTSDASTLVTSSVPKTSNITPTISTSNSPITTGSNSYIIRSGDTLSAIAQREGTTVSALMQANPNITNANLIYAGQSLNIPTSITTTGGSNASQQGSQSVTGGSGAVVQTEEQRKSDLAKALSEVQNRINAGTLDSTSLSPEVSTLIEKGQQEKTVTGESNADYYANLLEENKEEQRNVSFNGKTGYEALIEMIKDQAGLDISETRETAEERYKTEELRAQVSAQTQKVQALQAEVSQLQAEQASEIENARNRLSSMESISADINEINYNYGLKISKKTALMASEAALAQIYQGNLAEANNLVAQAVQDYTAEYQAKVDKFDNLFSVYASWIGELKSEEKEILQNARTSAQQKLEDAKAEATKVMEMKLQYSGAGINITDTLQEAVIKAEKYIVAEEAIAGTEIKTQVIGSAKDGYSLINSKTGEIIRQITEGEKEEEIISIADLLSETIDIFLDDTENNPTGSAEIASQLAFGRAEEMGLPLKKEDLISIRIRAEEIKTEKERIEGEEEKEKEEKEKEEIRIKEEEERKEIERRKYQLPYSASGETTEAVLGGGKTSSSVVDNFFYNLF